VHARRPECGAAPSRQGLLQRFTRAPLTGLRGSKIDFPSQSFDRARAAVHISCGRFIFIKAAAVAPAAHRARRHKFCTPPHANIITRASFIYEVRLLF